MPRRAGGGQPGERRQRLAVARHERVEVDEVANALGDVAKRAGDDAAAVGEADQHDAVEILVEHVVDDVAGRASTGRPAGS